ncbi:MAG: head decoration protein [Bdellovibrionales bacterium]
MTELTEGQHKAEFLVSEANGTVSRDVVTILAGQNLKAGHVLGQISVGSATGAAVSGNTGNGTLSSVTVGAKARSGIYAVTCVEPATGGGTFLVEAPDGVTVGTAHVGAAFNTEIGFTISAGATDFVSGDRFNVTVSSGSGKYKEYNPANTDGSETAVALLLDNINATAADVSTVAIVRQAEVNAAELIWFSGATQNQIAVGLNQLKQQAIIARSAI